VEAHAYGEAEPVFALDLSAVPRDLVAELERRIAGALRVVLTPSVRIAKKRSMISCQVSGSRSSLSSMELVTSANSTVTCLRSPSSAEREVRIFSARCRGV
jgi:hypothetical protein